MTLTKLSIGLVITLSLSACGRLPFVAGPCVHLQEGGLVRINSVSDTETGAPISPVRLEGLLLVGPGGQPDPDQGPLLIGEGARNIQIEGDALVCEVACRFGVMEGTYRFTVTAPGYETLEVEQEAHYTGGQGGCPSSATGSNVDLRLRLRKL